MLTRGYNASASMLPLPTPIDLANLFCGRTPLRTPSATAQTQIDRQPTHRVKQQNTKCTPSPIRAATVASKRRQFSTLGPLFVWLPSIIQAHHLGIPEYLFFQVVLGLKPGSNDSFFPVDIAIWREFNVVQWSMYFNIRKMVPMFYFQLCNK